MSLWLRFLFIALAATSVVLASPSVARDTPSPRLDVTALVDAAARGKLLIDTTDPKSNPHWGADRYSLRAFVIDDFGDAVGCKDLGRCKANRIVFFLSEYGEAPRARYFASDLACDWRFIRWTTPPGDRRAGGTVGIEFNNQCPGEIATSPPEANVLVVIDFEGNTIKVVPR